MMSEMQTTKCPNCGKMLCKTNGDIEVKCGRCKSMVRQTNGKISFVKEPVRTSSSGKRFI